MEFTRASLIAAPLCFAAYGVIRLIGKMDGQYGPGVDWQAAHLVNLAGLALFVLVVRHLRGKLPGTRGRDIAVVVTLAGVAATVVQFVVDVVAGLLASDKAEMNAITGQFASIPGARLVCYVVGPPLLYVGLLALAVLLVRARELPWWSPVLVLAGPALAIVSLDLLPVSGLCLLAALAPLAVRQEGTLPTNDNSLG